ncbi:MAG: hypothetical protein OFPI_34830 [Osedax symbiont Rs2]|nr:MAG: hypothetical protein OFPI_34830 [Osedax symbiont Rs2]
MHLILRAGRNSPPAVILTDNSEESPRALIWHFLVSLRSADLVKFQSRRLQSGWKRINDLLTHKVVLAAAAVAVGALRLPVALAARLRLDSGGNKP